MWFYFKPEDRGQGTKVRTGFLALEIPLSALYSLLTILRA